MNVWTSDTQIHQMLSESQTNINSFSYRGECYIKRYSKIDQDLALHFKYNGACLSSPRSSLLCSQIITPFL